MHGREFVSRAKADAAEAGLERYATEADSRHGESGCTEGRSVRWQRDKEISHEEKRCHT
jgi:hypothetical protein